MAEFIIYETNECFQVLPADKEHEENIWGECEISYSNIADKRGNIGIRFYKIFNTTDRRFDFSFFAKGEFHHVDGFGPEFSIDWEIKDKNTKDILQITGGDWTNQFGNKSIARGLQNFLNQLYQFETLMDLKKNKEIHDEDSWKNKGIKDKILLLAEIIKLYEKYSIINPSSYFLRDLDVKIKKNLNSLLNQV